MTLRVIKKIESWGKWLLYRIILRLFKRKNSNIFNKKDIQKILLFRLDQRIGNCLMLIPLINAIKASRPDIELHILIFYPVARLLKNSLVTEVAIIWPYHQQQLLHHPFRFLGWLFQFKKEKYDLIISSHNPDNFSVSQALFGLWCSPKLLIGFDWQTSVEFYDIAIKSSTDKHYCEAQIDLWRYFYPDVNCSYGGLHIHKDNSSNLAEDKNKSCFLIWLGSTGNKILPPNLVLYLYHRINDLFGKYPILAVGPSDNHLIANFPEVIGNKILVQDTSLLETANYFSEFQLFISGDTGPMHLAVALDLPTLTIFINSSLEQYGYFDGVKHFALNFIGTDADYSEIESNLLYLQKFLLGD